MKGFSATSFAADTGEMQAQAIAAVRKNPQALFTDFQWFLYKARNTVYFTAYSKEAYDHDQLIKLAGDMVTLAPQLTHGFVGAKPGQPLPQHVLEAVTTLSEVDDFDGYPDKWLEPGEEVFEQSDLPLFRVKAIVRRDGPDSEGRAAMLIIRSSHALMEGSDSALLSRSLNSGHGTMSSTTNKVPFKERLTYALIAAFTSPLHLIMAHLKSPPQQEMGFKSLKFNRAQIRRVSNKMGVNQRALMFGLVMYALNKGGRGFSEESIKSVYTTLDTDRRDADDDFFRVRSIDAQFDVKKDIKTFIEHINDRLGEVESKDTTKMQFVLNATFKTHRFLIKLVPFLYGKRFFRYNGNYDIVLTLVPPHRMYGNLTEGLMEPVYCGSYHPGSNLCTFVPAREYVTFNFSMRKNHLEPADKIQSLLDELEAE